MTNFDFFSLKIKKKQKKQAPKGARFSPWKVSFQPSNPLSEILFELRLYKWQCHRNKYSVHRTMVWKNIFRHDDEWWLDDSDPLPHQSLIIMILYWFDLMLTYFKISLGFSLRSPISKYFNQASHKSQMQITIYKIIFYIYSKYIIILLTLVNCL